MSEINYTIVETKTGLKIKADQNVLTVWFKKLSAFDNEHKIELYHTHNRLTAIFVPIAIYNAYREQHPKL